MSAPGRSAAAGIARGHGGVPLGRQHRADAGVGRGRLGAARHPGLQVVDLVDDTAAEFRVARAGAIGAVLLQGAAGQAEEARSLGVRR